MNQWFWCSYAILFSFTSIGHAFVFFHPQSPAIVYYVTLMGFHKAYALLFLLNILAILVTAASNIPVLFYALQIRLQLWQWLFYLRLLLDLTGHHYEWKFLQSIFTHDFTHGLVALGAWIFPLIPSYIAHYLYTFKNK